VGNGNERVEPRDDRNWIEHLCHRLTMVPIGVFLPVVIQPSPALVHHRDQQNLVRFR